MISSVCVVVRTNVNSGTGGGRLVTAWRGVCVVVLLSCAWSASILAFFLRRSFNVIVATMRKESGSGVMACI